MKCPKCQYISFDQSDRCRNCGYEFSLSVDVAELDLPIRTGDEAIGPLSDFSLADVGDPSSNAEVDAVAPSRRAAFESIPSPDLPLFRDRHPEDDRPLVNLPASPRAPVAVRKSAPVRSSPPRPSTAEPGLDLEPGAPVARLRGSAAAAAASAAAEGVGESEVPTARAGARLGGALIDLLLLAGIDAGVLYLTLRLCGLEPAEAGRIPVVPFAAFIALLNGGYMAAFTAAGGQSIGKMAAGTRVVTMDESAPSDRVPLGQAVLRAAGYLVSVLPAGIGFLPALIGSDRRALHDRLANTRVVKA